MNRERSLLFIVVLGLIAASSLHAQTYYVGPTGNDLTNPGTAALPFREIRKGLTVVKAGDTILVADGQYKGFDVAGLQGTLPNPITIQAQGSNAVVNVTTDRSDNRDTIKITLDNNTGTIPSTYIIIDGLSSFNATRSGMRVDQCPHITVRNCTFGNCTVWGMFTDFSDFLLIENNNCYGSVQQHGCYVSNTCTGAIVRGNRFHDNFANGLHMNGDVSQGGAGIITNALIEKNVIYSNGLGGGGSGINCDGVQSSVFRNNLIYNAHGAGISLYQTDASAASDNNVVVNNTFDIASDGKWGIQLHSGSKNNTVFNNIFVTHHSFHGSIHIDIAASMTGLVSDYNVLTTSNDCATVNNDVSYLTFAQWKGLGFDTHSLTATQASLFVNSASGDYHLLNGSPAIDAGVATLNGKVPPADDCDGSPRPSGVFDIGSFELQSGVLTITTSSPLPAGTIGTAYSQSFGANGRSGPYTWVISGGTLPSGLSLSASGVLTGTPTTAGTSNFTVQVTDSTSTTKTKSFALTIASQGTKPPPGGGGAVPPTINSPPSSNTSPIVVNVPVTFTAGATDPSGGTVSYQWNFGDGSTGTGASATHTYTTPGSYTVTVTITSSSGGVTTSSLNVTVVAASIPMTVTKMQGVVKFSVAAHDGISVTGTIPNLPKLFDPTGQSLTVNISGASVTFKLDGKGRGKTTQGAITLKLKPTLRNKATKKNEFQGGNVPFTLKLQHGSWAGGWGMSGTASVSNSPLPMNATIQLGGNKYVATVTVKYSGKAHVSGKFKK